jgi:hypothetical protein
MPKIASLSIASLLLSAVIAFAEQIERHEVYVKDGDTVIIGPGVLKLTRRSRNTG